MLLTLESGVKWRNVQLSPWRHQLQMRNRNFQCENIFAFAWRCHLHGLWNVFFQVMRMSRQWSINLGKWKIKNWMMMKRMGGWVGGGGILVEGCWPLMLRHMPDSKGGVCGELRSLGRWVFEVLPARCSTTSSQMTMNVVFWWVGGRWSCFCRYFTFTFTVDICKKMKRHCILNVLSSRPKICITLRIFCILIIPRICRPSMKLKPSAYLLTQLTTLGIICCLALFF